MDRSTGRYDCVTPRSTMHRSGKSSGTKIGNRNFLVEKYTAASSGAQPARLHTNPMGSQPGAETEFDQSLANLSIFKISESFVRTIALRFRVIIAKLYRAILRNFYSNKTKLSM